MSALYDDYAGLQAAVEEYLGWDVDGSIPLLISQAEQRMQRDLRLRVMERRGTNITVPGGVDNKWLPDKRIPGDWDVFLEMREVCLKGAPNVNLDYVAPDAFTDMSYETGAPRAYSIVGRSLMLAPTPDKAYTILLTYYGQIPPLSEAQPTNEMLLNYPDIYLYATLAQSAIFLRQSVPGPDWMALYNEAKNAANYADARARWSKNIAAKPPRRSLV